MQLTNEELDQFHTLGYVVKPAVFTQSDMQPIKAAINETVNAKARQLYAAGQLADLCANEPFETRLAAIQAVDAAAAQAIVQHLSGKGGGGYSGPAMLAMLRHASLLGCITSLIGPDIVGSSVYRIRPKMPLWTRGEVPWHQDSGYLDATIPHPPYLTCWCALDDMSEENGTVYVLPQSRLGIRARVEHQKDADLNDLVGYFGSDPGDPILCRAGSIALFSSHTFHRSGWNRSPRLRRVYLIQYSGEQIHRPDGGVHGRGECFLRDGVRIAQR